ncbi:MAG: polysaccharide deacetylase family protein [Kofleriaceae bacterium]|nr:polysaccharide deacetylase family protein [Kofleriaceae bacterium]MBP9167056.1 polysaccharide deacetylase family protein [Kofleriaceae bacterium]MBP9860230.1 polysaccharide deacetylase family protein [Kofleriaceae bacterium]
MGVRARVASALHRTGALGAALTVRRRLPARSVAIVTYHHVCDPDRDYPFDPDVADVTPAQFRRQLALLARHFTIIDLPTLEASLDGAPLPPNPCLITFDDGYRSNLTVALPALREVGATATFFIATGFTTHRRLYWWDRIAYLVHHAQVASLALTYPTARTVPLADRGAARGELTKLVKNTRGLDLGRFLDELATAAGVPWSRERERALADELIMTWDEIRALAAAGMAIESHTRDHRVLESLPAAELADDLAGARAELARELGGPRYAIAYPVGRSIAGYPEVRAAVAAAGYRLGFTNASGRLRVVGRPGLDRLDLARVAVDRDLPDAVFLAQLTSDRFGFVRRAPSP